MPSQAQSQGGTPKPPKPRRIPPQFGQGVPSFTRTQGVVTPAPKYPPPPQGFGRTPLTNWQGLSNPPMSQQQGAGSPAPKPPKKPPTEPAHEPLPLDPRYMEDTATATKNLTDTLTDLGVRKTRLVSDTGYNPDDTVNYSDPFSRQAELKRAFDQRKAANTTTMAARGQLYAGALQNVQNASQRGFLQDTNTTLKAFHDSLYGFGREESGARNAYTLATQAAERARVARALANRPTAPGLSPIKNKPTVDKRKSKGLARWQGVSRPMTQLQGWTGRTKNVPNSAGSRRRAAKNRRQSGAAANQGYVTGQG